MEEKSHQSLTLNPQEDCLRRDKDDIKIDMSSTEVARCILYIDDNAINLKLVSRILSNKKHINLITAQTPTLGIAIAIKKQPDLILLDINMPEMNGFQVLDVFKQNQHFKNIPIIAVTANAMPDDIEYGKAMGFDDYITKPIDYEHLLETIYKHLEYRKSHI
jgi:CheY-like chemotaxis protein